MATTELTKKLSFVNPSGVTKQVTLYDDYTQFNDYDNGNYIAIQTTTGEVGYVYCNSTLPSDVSNHFASFIDKNGNVRYAYLVRQDEQDIPEGLIARYTFTTELNVMPSLGGNTTYTTKDRDNGDGTTTREIYSGDGSMPISISFNNKIGLKTVEYLNTSACTNLLNLFYKCTNLTSVDMSKSDTSKVDDMRGMFYECSSLTSLDISGFNTSKVTTFGTMFYGCTALPSLDLSSFEVSGCGGFGSMFYKCNSLTSLDLSHFITTKAQNMNSMFKECTSLQNLRMDNFTSAKLSSYSSMFTSVPSTCNIYRNASKFTLRASNVGFSGKFKDA